jgi:hypothetical protein
MLRNIQTVNMNCGRGYTADRTGFTWNCIHFTSFYYHDTSVYKIV